VEELSMFFEAASIQLFALYPAQRRFDFLGIHKDEWSCLGEGPNYKSSQPEKKS